VNRSRTHQLVARGAALVALGAALLACHKKLDATGAPPDPPAHVTVVDVVEKPMARGIRLTGTLRGQQQTDLAADASGKVIATFVERGTEVKKGDVIAKLDVRAAAASAAEASAMVELSRAQAESATRDCERYKDLLARKAITQAEFDRTADACKTQPLSLRAAQARASAASLNVTDGVIKAPFAGVVVERKVEVGQYVHADSKVATIVDVDPLRLEFTVPEANVAAVKKDVALTFSVVAFPGKTFPGVVKFVSGAVRDATRDVVAEAEVPNGEHELMPGMFADVTLETGEEKTPVVPSTAIFKREEHDAAYAVVAGHLEERAVQLGVTKGAEVAVLRGLKAGEKVVDKPDPKLFNGQAVE
jgi:RND family efflux transporter MFP subunit